MSSDHDEKRQGAAKPSPSSVWLPPTPESLFTPLSTNTPASRVPFEPLPPAALPHGRAVLSPSFQARREPDVVNRSGGPPLPLPLVKDSEELAHCRLPPILSMLSDRVPAPHNASRLQGTRAANAVVAREQPSSDGIVIDEALSGSGDSRTAAQGSRKRPRVHSSGSSEGAVDHLAQFGQFDRPRSSLVSHDDVGRGEELEELERRMINGFVADESHDPAESKGKRMATSTTSNGVASLPPPSRHNLRARRKTRPTSALYPVLQEDGLDVEEEDQMEDDDDEDYSASALSAKWKATASQASSSTRGSGGGAGAGAGGRERERAPGRRISHSLIERRRRERINDCLQKLRNMVPQCSALAELKRQKSRRRNRPAAAAGDEHAGGGNMHKLEILLGTIEYVEELRARVEELERERHSASHGVKTGGARGGSAQVEPVVDSSQRTATRTLGRLTHNVPSDATVVAATSIGGIQHAASGVPTSLLTSQGLSDDGPEDGVKDLGGNGERSPSTDATEDDAAVLLLALASPDLRPVVT
jgi:Helix-loop-helix DNA-binding domain